MKEKDIIIIYDGDCGICSYFMQFAERKTRKKLSLFPFVTDSLANQYGLQLHELAKVSVIVIENSKIYSHSSALRRIFSYMGLVYKIPALLLAFKPIEKASNILYKYIARNRHKLSKLFGMNACKIKPQ